MQGAHGKMFEFTRRIVRIDDEPGSGGKGIRHPLAVTVGLAGPAILRVRDRDQVVDQIDGANALLGNPWAKIGRVEARMADVQIKLPCYALSSTQEGCCEYLNQVTAEVRHSMLQQFKKPRTVTFGQYIKEPTKLDDCPGPITEML